LFCSSPWFIMFMRWEGKMSPVWKPAGNKTITCLYEGPLVVILTLPGLVCIWDRGVGVGAGGCLSLAIALCIVRILSEDRFP
jgi:hypothetical protein